jgi:hypothetical protein
MGSEENNQEGRFERATAGSNEETANNILSMWDSQEQTASEETKATSDEEVVEETKEAENTEEETPEGQVEEEVEEEVSEESEESEEEEFEVVAEEDLKYTIKVDGKEYEVGIDELKSGYQRQADYTRKSQALAEQRKETEQIQSERQQLEQERQMYANGLQMLREQQTAKLQDFDTVDWETLKQEDPYAYMIKKDEYRDAQERVNNVAYQQEQVQNEQMQQAQQAKTHFIRQEYTRLVEALPEWENKDSFLKV